MKRFLAVLTVCTISLFSIPSYAASKKDCNFIKNKLLSDVGEMVGYQFGRAIKNAGLTREQGTAILTELAKIVDSGDFGKSDSGKKVIQDLKVLNCH